MAKRENDVLTYDESSVQVLEGLGAVRRRPGMYVGGTDSRGLHHLVYEVVDNSIDEALACACDKIEVIIHKDRSVTVRDNGRGIPTAPHPEKKISTLQLVMTTLHAGAKFGGGGYKVSGGLHGVGVSAVNALSEWLEVVVDNPRDGLRYRQRYERGVPVTPVETIGKTNRRGTTVTFRFDPTIFKDVDYQFDVLAQRMRELAFVARGVTILLIDERPDDFPRRMTFYFEGGVLSFVRYLNRNRTPLHPPVHVEKEVGGVGVEVAIQYTDSYTESVYPFANTIHTVDGGTHLTGLRAALTRTINDYARKAGLLKEKDSNFSGDDVREGLTAVVSVKHPDPQFESQTKVKLMNAEVKGIVESVVAEAFMEFLERDSTSARRIVEKCLTSSRARAAARQARDLVIRKSVLESTTLPGKLADCSERDHKRTELFIVEGDSAGGSAKQGRDRHFQAILPLRGKILNTERASINKVLSSKEIQALISALGTGIGDQFNLEGLRYRRVIIMSVDADEFTLVKDPSGQICSVRVGPFIDRLIADGIDPSHYQVLGFDPQSGAVGFKPLRAVIRHDHEGVLYEIETAYGRRIRVTGEHSVFVAENGRLMLKRGDAVREGDQLVAPARLPCPESSPPQAAQAIPPNLPVNESLMLLLGFFVAEGSLSPRNGVRLAIARRNESRVPELIAAIRQVFGVEPTVYAARDGRAGELRILNRAVVAVFRLLFGPEPLDARHKRIPDLVFNVDRTLQMAFLRGYFLGDGTLSRRQIQFTTTSETLTNQLMYLLLMHDKWVSVSEVKSSGKVAGRIGGNVITRRTAYHLTISDQDAIAYLEPVWADHARAPEVRQWLTTSRGRRGRQTAPSPFGDLVALPVKAVRPVPPSTGKAYDFSVAGDETFICGRGGVCAKNTDADVDGAHIRTLLLTFFYRYMQPLVEEGHLFIAQPPLYRIATSKQVFYAYSDTEKEKILKKLEGEKVTIQRYKGLGEMNPEQLWETTMDPSQRSLLQVTVEDAAEADRIFTMLMGDAVLPRRRFIQTHAREVRNLDV